MTTPKPIGMDSIDLGKKWLRENFEEGAKCPCCAQHVKLYKRKLTSSMAYGLILLYKHHQAFDVVHLENFFKSIDAPSSIRGDMSKFRYWDILEKVDGSREDGNPSNGCYRLTLKGQLFAQNKIKVPERIKIYNNVFYGYDGDEVSIRGVLKSKFDYQELLNS